MGGISSGGLISGIDTQSLINSLIQVAARPRTLAQGRLFQLQSQQAAYLSLNTRLGSLRDAASSFRSSNAFQAKLATSSNSDVLSATASIGAQPGSYSFIVDRLVSSQQQLSRGFQDLDITAMGAESFTFESELGRVDRDLSLNALNDGDGVTRGSIRINDGSTIAEIDLSRVGTVGEVIDEINNSGLNVTARVRDGSFVIEGATNVSNTGNAEVIESLGLDVSAGAEGITGRRVYELTGSVSLNSLNDGNGVSYRSSSSGPNGLPATDFTITVGGVSVDIGLGEIRETDDNGTPDDTSDDTNDVVDPAVTTVQGLLNRINQSFTDAGVDASASIDAESGSLSFDSNAGNIESIVASNESNALRDLGIQEISSGGSDTNVSGSRIFAGLGTVLLSSLNGGGENGGIGSSGRIDFTTADGELFEVNLNLSDPTQADYLETLEDVIDAINQDPDNGGTVVASLNETGTGISITDTTRDDVNTGNLIIEGAIGDDLAERLGIATGPAGVAAGSVDGSSLQRRYVSEGTLLSSLRNGDGIGTGKFRIIDSAGQTAEVNIGESVSTVGELLSQIESAIGGLANVEVGINDQGDGIVIRDTSTGGQPLRIEDEDGVVARNLRIAGEASGTDGDNFIDGSYETTVTFDPSDTLEDIVAAINDSDAQVAVSILNDGSGTRPFRLSLTALDSGVAGRYTLDTNGFDLGISTLDDGEDARVIFGSNDAANGILLTSSSNTLDSVVTGLTIDLKAADENPVTVSVTDDTSSVEESINTFIEAYNSILDNIESATVFDEESGQRGALLGDGLLLGLRRGLFNAFQSPNSGFNNAFDRLTEVGLSIGGEGRLEFDREEFREALAEDPEAVEALFTRRVLSDDDSSEADLPDGVTINDPNARDLFDELGAIGQIEQYVKNYTDSIDGILTSRTNALDSQILNQQSRIDSLTEGLDRERLRLERQFVGMEQALAQLQSQSAALSSLTSLG